MFGPRTAFWFRWSTLCGVLASLTGCGSGSGSQLPLAVIEEPATAGPASLDRPLAAQLARAATAQGLVAFDEQGRVVPALADRWIVTDDGESYIFRLREGEWRNGDPLTARAARAALEAAMRAVRKTPLGLDLGAVDEVRVMAGRVIEIRLHRPMPHFLQLLAQPELGLVHRKLGDGPMTLDRREVRYRTPPRPARNARLG
jgi:ABC-type transport system substrate-binding protein